MAMMMAVLIPAQSAFAFSDVPNNYWDYNQIKYVAIDHTWMQDYGPGTFQPHTLETRSFLARSMVQMFAPDEPTDPNIHFPDLPDGSPFYPYANVAVKLGWIQTFAGKWSGTTVVPRSLLDQALTLALGLQAPLLGLHGIHEDDGTPYHVGSRWEHVALASYLRLHYNHSEERLDLQFATRVPRDEVAYSLYTAYTMPAYLLESTRIFDDVSLPTLDLRIPGQNVQHLFTQYALNFVGFPYIWGGEWNAQSPQGYCCGYQPQGGFDCSGFMWWVLKKYEDGYNSARYHPYPGWSLHERTSYQMAQWTPKHIPLADVGIGNLLFFASNGGKRWQDVDHVGMYIGNSWMIHSTADGPQLAWVGSGWYHDHFVWGRWLTSKGEGHVGWIEDPTGGDAVADGGMAASTG
jgi:NlpC/P60 family protein